MSEPLVTGPTGLTSPGRLVATLGGLGALSGLLIVLVFGATEPAIRAHRAAVLAEAIMEVLLHFLLRPYDVADAAAIALCHLRTGRVKRLQVLEIHGGGAR